MAEDFRGLAVPLSDGGFSAAGDVLGAHAAEIWAVLTVETHGFGYLEDRRPRILFERHVFSRLTGGRFDGADPTVSNPVAGGYQGGAAEYLRLARASALEPIAALQSASWGIGQVMGFNAELAGYRDAREMVAAMTASEDEQLLAMGRFIAGSKLAAPLRSRDWTAFARGYNGAGYARNQYDSRLRGAFAKFAAGPLPDLQLRRAQGWLLYLGLNPGPVDGVMGRFTRAALTEFQSHEQLARTGEIDDETLARLAERVRG